MIISNILKKVKDLENFNARAARIPSARFQFARTLSPLCVPPPRRLIAPPSLKKSAPPLAFSAPL